MEHRRHKYNITKQITYIVVGICAVFLIASALSGGRLPGFLEFAQFNPSQQQQMLSDFGNKDGYVEIKKTDTRPVVVGRDEGFTVNVTAIDKQITGFTIPVSYNKGNLKFVRAESLDDRFSMYYRIEDASHLILVGVQRLANIDKIVLHKKDVARVVFKALAGGSTVMAVEESTPKGYELKLQDEKNDALKPSSGILQFNATAQR